MKRPVDALLALSIPLLILLYLVLTPYTKVEESFNLQATHDILTYGLIPSKDSSINIHIREKYDHVDFPGSVPRTFVGPVVLATIASPFARLVRGVNRQILVRAILGLFNAFGLLSYRNSIASAYGRSAANWYVLLQASQYQIIFYSSRTLPNFFAFALTTPALRKLLPSPGLSPETQRRRYRNAFMLLTIAGVVFRAEIAVLIAMHAAYFFLTRRISLYTLIEAGAMGLMIGLAVSVPLDSLLWQRPVWPELSGFIFNVLNGKAVEWGTSPWHAYFTRSLPNLLLSPLTYILLIPTAILQPALRSAVQDLLIPNLAFIAIYSIQPHKEARFIVYAIPPLTAAASLGASWIWTRRSKGAIYNVLNLALVTSTLATFAASIVFVLISCLNYPGAEALSRLHMLADGTQPVLKVHMDTLTCMTGVTRFSEIDPQLYIPQQSFPSATDSSEGEEEKGTSSTAHWVYSKMENQTVLLNPLFWEGFDYAITETPERVIGKWELREWVYGYAGIGSLGLQPEVETKDVVRHMLEGFPAVVRDVVGEGMVMMEKWTRRATGGRWIGVRMEKKLAILQKQHSI